MSVPSSIHTDTVISHSVICTSLSPLSFHNGFQRNKISKLGAAVITRDITSIIPETLEIFRKSGSGTSQSIIMAAYNTGLLTIYGIKKHNKKLPVRILVSTGAV